MENKGLKILIIDDEPQIRKLLKVALEAYNYDLQDVATGKDGIMTAASMHPDIIIVDLGLPDMDGKEVVKRLREWSSVPIIVLTARDQEQEKIQVLDQGADDYITKPFSMGELMARIRVCLRRSYSEDDKKTEMVCGGVCMDLLKRIVTVDGKEVKLTPTEYDLLKIMMKHAGRVLTHKQLLKAVWGTEYDEDLHYIRIYMRQLRRKIEADPAQPRYLITESGIGYRFAAND